MTIVRDPYATFISYYFSVQSRKAKGTRRDILRDKPLDHPDVLTFLGQGSYRGPMQRAKGWLESGRSSVVRYGDLHRDPLGILTRLGECLGAVPKDKLERAVEACSAENMRKAATVRPGHVRAAKVGDSRDRLNESHLAIFRDRYADLIHSLGYEVR